MSESMLLTYNEVIERYRDQLSAYSQSSFLASSLGTISATLADWLPGL
jgi:hypothetical protein